MLPGFHMPAQVAFWCSRSVSQPWVVFVFCLMPCHAVPCRAVLCCQVALEGAINSKLAQSSLARGELPQGDLIPWTMGQQFQVGCCCWYCSYA
jgi:hypothetical protein